jgi:hypothetical protein
MVENILVENFIRGVIENPFQGNNSQPPPGRWNFWIPVVERNSISMDIKTTNQHHTIRLIKGDGDRIHFISPSGDRYESFSSFLDIAGLRFTDHEDYFREQEMLAN